MILAAFLVAYIVFITVRLKRRHDRGELEAGPYQGTALSQDHPAAHITPFGATGPNGGKRGPEFSECDSRGEPFEVKTDQLQTTIQAGTCALLSAGQMGPGISQTRGHPSLPLA